MAQAWWGPWSVWLHGDLCMLQRQTQRVNEWSGKKKRNLEKTSNFIIPVIILQSSKETVLKYVFVFHDIAILEVEQVSYFVKCPSIWTYCLSLYD